MGAASNVPACGVRTKLRVACGVPAALGIQGFLVWLFRLLPRLQIAAYSRIALDADVGLEIWLVGCVQIMRWLWVS